MLPGDVSANLSTAFTPDGKVLLTGGKDGKVRRFHTGSWRRLENVLVDHGEAVVELVVSPDGRRLLTRSIGSPLPGVAFRGRLWSLPDGKPLGEAVAAGFPPYHFGAGAFTAGGTLLTRWFKNERPSFVHLWGGEGQSLGRTDGMEGSMEIAALHPDGRSFATASHDGHASPLPLRLWNGRTGKPIGTHAPMKVSLGAAAFHPSGQFLALGCYEEHARLWSGTTNKLIGPPVLHPGPVTQVAFTPDGSVLATVGKDHTVRLWKVPEPMKGNPEQIRLRMQVLTQQELDEAGGVRKLTWREVDAHRKQMTQAVRPAP